LLGYCSLKEASKKKLVNKQRFLCVLNENGSF
jgi:hypothetical protein